MPVYARLILGLRRICLAAVACVLAAGLPTAVPRAQDPSDEPPALKAARQELIRYGKQARLTGADIDRIAAIAESIGHDKSMFPR